MIDASFDVLLDYHDCPVCGIGQLIEADDDDCGRGCASCGSALFLDPMLIWPTGSPDARADVA